VRTHVIKVFAGVCMGGCALVHVLWVHNNYVANVCMCVYLCGCACSLLIILCLCVLYCIVLYLYIYIALLAVHTDQKR